MIVANTFSLMKTSRQIRYENARALAVDGPADFARKLSDISDKSMSGQQANQIIGPNASRGIGDDIARRVEKAYGKEEGWLDNDHNQNNLEALISGANNVLSDEAKALIRCVVQLDTVGDLARKTFVYSRGLLQLSASYTELQTGSARAQVLAEIESHLPPPSSPRIETPEPRHERKNKK